MAPLHKVEKKLEDLAETVQAKDSMGWVNPVIVMDKPGRHWQIRRYVDPGDRNKAILRVHFAVAYCGRTCQSVSREAFSVPARDG